MSVGDNKRGSWADAHSRPPAARQASVGPLSEGAPEPPAKSPLDCIRHDAGSAVHSLHGFIELLTAGAFGPLTEAQMRSVHHLRGAGQRLFELVECSLEMQQTGRSLPPAELRVTPLAQLVAGVVHSSRREHAELSIELELPLAQPREEALVAVAPESFVRALRLALDALLESGSRALDVRVSRGKHEAVVHLSGEREETSVSQSIPMHRIDLRDVDQVSAALSNRSYLQLKRCEALLARHGASLQIAGDLSRLRIALPLVSG
jgi:hypothetical protein